MQSMDLIAIQIVMLALMASVYKMFNYLVEPPDVDLTSNGCWGACFGDFGL